MVYRTPPQELMKMEQPSLFDRQKQRLEWMEEALKLFTGELLLTGDGEAYNAIQELLNSMYEAQQKIAYALKRFELKLDPKLKVEKVSKYGDVE